MTQDYHWPGLEICLLENKEIKPDTILLLIIIMYFSCRLPYDAIFGGVTALRKEHFKMVNGYSNIFFGWGGEDDDMSSR